MIAPQLVSAPLADPHVGTVLGVKVSGLDADATLHFIRGLVDSGESHQVCTAHATGLVQAKFDKALAKVFNSASLVVCDSEGVRWALGRKGHSVAKVAGVSLVESICQLSSERGLRIFLYGAEPGVAEQAAELLAERFPRAQIVGALDGYHGAEDLTARLESIRSMGIDILLLGMGVPKQEFVARQAVEMKTAAVCMGVGGSFDVLSGRLKRAPQRLQHWRLEWLWRTLIDRRKVRNIPLLVRFVIEVLRDK